MSGRVEKDMSELRSSLDKAVLASEEESLKDLLTAVAKLPISIDLLKATKIGQTLQDIKKKFITGDVGQQAKALISKWKKDCESQSAPKTEATVIVPSTSSAKTQEPELKRSSSQDLEDDTSEEHYNQLPAMRKTVCTHCSMNLPISKCVWCCRSWKCSQCASS